MEKSAGSEFLLNIRFYLSLSRSCSQLCADSAHGVSLDKLTLNFVKILRQISASFCRTAAVSSVLCSMCFANSEAQYVVSFDAVGAAPASSEETYQTPSTREQPLRYCTTSSGTRTNPLTCQLHVCLMVCSNAKRHHTLQLSTKLLNLGSEIERPPMTSKELLLTFTDLQPNRPLDLSSSSSYIPARQALSPMDLV